MLHRRLRELRSRAAIRRWETRQLAHAGGVWYRLARLLTYARSAWSLSDADAERLIGAGHAPHPVGLELEPPRRVFVVTEETVAALPSAREVPLVSSPELLVCRNLALVPFEVGPVTATAR
jgi:hypothetical protein